MKGLSENAINVYKRLYFSKMLGEGNPSEVHNRVAEFASEDDSRNFSKKDQENRFFQMMEDNEFRPNSPFLMNAGVVTTPQTSACFVGALSDSLESIFDFDREAGFIYAQGSGLGGNYGTLREISAKLSTGGESSGPFAFMKKLASTAEAVKSGGRTRRAAHMAMMFDHHPDIKKFIHLKDGNDQTYASMNLSIAASDAFMEAVVKDKAWALISVVDKSVTETIRARELFDDIVNNAHKCGDPGFWFIDAANRDNTLKEVGRIVSTNPCGEQALLPYQSCALAAINVAKCVSHINLEGKTASFFNWQKFVSLVTDATRFLDNSIDKSGYPTPQYKKMAIASRPIGLGIMGFADALLLLGFSYGSEESIEFGKKLALGLTRSAIKASLQLAIEKGPFALWTSNKKSVVGVVSQYFDSEDIDDAKTLANIKSFGVRNSQWTTIAPTGSTSISCDCSQGMEPHFAICYAKLLSDSGETWNFAHPLFTEWYSDRIWYKEALPLITKNHGSCHGIELIPQDVRNLWACAHDISWEDRIKMQAALQIGISNSISSTINLPNEASAEEIGKIYMTAWKSGCKGLTVYRDRSLDAQPISFGDSNDMSLKEMQESQPIPPAFSREPKKIRHGRTHEINTGHGKVYFTINMDEAGRPCELFTNGSKNGSVNAANLEAMGRLVSKALQNGTPIVELAKTLENINDGTNAWVYIDESDERPVRVISIPDAMGKVLKRFYCNATQEMGMENPEIQEVLENVYSDEEVAPCIKCGSPLYHHDGCLFCPECGSQCS